MARWLLLGCMALAGCVQPDFQMAGVPPAVAAECKLMAVSQPDRTVYTHSITGSLLLSGAINSAKQQQVFNACVEALEYRVPGVTPGGVTR